MTSGDKPCAATDGRAGHLRLRGVVAVLAVVVLSVGDISAAALRLVTRRGRGYSLADSTPSTVSRGSAVRNTNVSVSRLSAERRDGKCAAS
jgi:hypothetical protein